MPPIINTTTSVLDYAVGAEWFYQPKATGEDRSTNPQWATPANLTRALPPATTATATALPTNTYSNGVSGEGATLTASANGALTVAGIALVGGDIVLVKNEAAALKNGLYVVTSPGSAGTPWLLTRHPEMDSTAEIVGYVDVLMGTNALRIYLCPPPIAELGVSAIAFAEWKNRWDVWDLPAGLRHNVATGAITGAGAAPGVGIVGLRASSDSGATWSAPLELTIGLYGAASGSAGINSTGYVDLTVDLQTGEVEVIGTLTVTQGDDRLLRVAFEVEGNRIDLGVLKSLRLGVVEYIDDGPLYIGGGSEDDEETPPLYGSLGEGENRIYLLAVHFGDDFNEALDAVGRDTEAISELRAELEWSVANDTGVGPLTLRQSSAQFAVKVVRDIVTN